MTLSVSERVHFAIDWAFVKLSWVPRVVSIAAGGLSLLLSTLAGASTADPVAFWWLLVLGVLAGAVAATMTLVIDSARRGNEGRLIREGAESQEAARNALLPAIRSLARLADTAPSERQIRYGKTIECVTNAREYLFQRSDQVRVVAYRRQNGAGQRKRSLVVEGHSGRPANEPNPFVDGDGGRGRDVFKWLEGGKTRFVADTHDEPDTSGARTENGYRTYISVPVRVGDRTLGMLTVDAPEPGQLDETDIPMAELLATMLGSAYVLYAK